MTRLACGAWKSPITSQSLVEGSISIQQICTEGDFVYWTESRPEEKGRVAIMKKIPEGNILEVLPKEYSARSRIHEYGGGEFTVHNNIIYFINDKDQNIYRLQDGSPPELVYEDPNKRFSQFLIHPKDSFLYCVVEDHENEKDVQNYLARIHLETKKLLPIATGFDFYGGLALESQGKRLAWICWNRPNMPWDGTELWTAEIKEDGTLSKPRFITGGQDESIVQPEFGPDGHLYFISDASGFWNIYRQIDDNFQCIYKAKLEFGEPMWLLGGRRFVFLPKADHHWQIAAIYTDKAVDYLGIIDIENKTLTNMELPFTSIGGFCSCLCVYKHNKLIFQAASPVEFAALMEYDLNKKHINTIRKSKENTLEKEYISEGESIEFPTDNGTTAFGFFYAPKNPNYAPHEQELPPLIVRCHGGPSGHVANQLQMETQFWTSRGIAVFNVNYGGSTGYGREYRKRLNDNWGIVDVADCCNGATYLAAQNRIDGSRMIIKGGSAGGFTVLAALAFKDVFQAGVSYYGVSDLTALAKDTHKFESRYLDYLVGPYPEREDLYVKRSPINYADRISSPLLILQGGKDKVVPKSQAEQMYQALLQRKIPVSYVLFPEEAHGFRQSENIQKSIESELYFYSKIFHFPVSDDLEHITIENL
ncbi:MAG: S9 family peptidase [Simkaniaceae bacterium]